MKNLGLIFVLVISNCFFSGAQDSVEEKINYLLIKDKQQELNSDVDELKNTVIEINEEVAVLRTENQGLKDRLDDQNEWIGIWTAVFLGVMAAAGVITVLVGRNQAKKVAKEELKDIQDTKLDAERELTEVEGISKSMKEKIAETAPKLKKLTDELDELTKRKDELKVELELLKTKIKDLEKEK